MSKISLDLKKFKHVKSDDKSTTLQHQDGHTLTIAKNALSPHFQQQLEALSKISKDAATSTQANEAKNQQMAKGGMAEEHIKKSGEKIGERFKKASEDVKQYGSPEHKQKLQEAHDKVINQIRESDKPKLSEGGMAEECYEEGGLIDQAKKAFSGSFGEYKEPSDADKKEGNKPSPKIDPEKAAAAQKSMQENRYADGGDIEENRPPKKDVPDLDVTKMYPTQQVSSAPDYNLMYKKEVEGLTNPTPPPGPPMVGPTPPPSSSPDQIQGLALERVARQKQADEQIDINKQKQLQNDYKVALDNYNKKVAMGIDPGEKPIPPDSLQEQKQDLSPTPTTPVQMSDSQAAPMAAAPSDKYDPEGLLKQGYKGALKGIEAEAAAKGALGEEQAKQYNNAVQAQQEAKQSFSNEFQKLDAERQAHIQDINAGHIDPEKYWNDHSKIASGIGMILAGFNPTNSPNAALNFLKFQMENNLKAQETNLNSKQNLLRANLEQFHNLRDATDMTRIMQHDIVANQLASAASKAQTPLAKAAGMQAAAKLKMDVAPMFQQFAMRRALMNLSNGDSSNPDAVEKMIGMMNAMGMGEQAKFYQDRLIPGMGLAKVPVPQEIRQELIAKKQYDQKAKEYVDFAKKHSMNWANLNLADRAAISSQGAAMGANLQSLYRNKIKGGVYKKGEQEFIQQIIPDNPANWAASLNAIPKVEQTIHDNTADLSSTAQGYGIPVRQSQQQAAPSAHPLEGKTASDNKGNQIIMKNGKWVPLNGR